MRSSHSAGSLRSHRICFGVAGTWQMGQGLVEVVSRNWRAPWTQVLRCCFCRSGLDLSADMPVNAWDQMLMVLSPCQSAYTLLLGLLVQNVFNLPPWCLERDLIAQQKLGFLPGPVHEIVGVPVPFLQVGNGGCHRSSYRVPIVLLLL